MQGIQVIVDAAPARTTWPVLKTQLDQQISYAETLIADWAGHPEWAGLDASTPAAQASSAPVQSSPGAMLSYHYQNNAQQTTQLAADPVAPDGTGSDVGAVLEQESQTLYDAAQRLIDLGWLRSRVRCCTRSSPGPRHTRRGRKPMR